MQRMGVVERTVAASETRCARDRALDIGPATIDRTFDAKSLCKACGNRRGKAAAGAVRMTGGDAGAFPDPRSFRGHEYVRQDFAGEVTAFDQHCMAAEGKQPLTGGTQFGNRANRHPAQDFRFRQVRSDNLSTGNEQAL